MENSLSATDDFVSFLLSIQNLNPMTVLAVFFLTLARIMPIIAIAPFLGARNLPRIVRMMFGIALCMLFLPLNILNVRGDIAYDMVYVGYFLKEIMIGFVLGLFASAPFFIAQSTGTLIDHSRGSSALQVSDPTTQAQTGDTGVVYNYILIAIFYSIGGPFLFFEGLANSYELIPVDGLLGSVFFHSTSPFWKEMMTLLQIVTNLSLQLAAPALIGMLLTDLFLGIANRLAPQVQVVFLGIPLKSWVGIALMTVAWALMIQVMEKESISWIKMVNKFIKQASWSVIK